MQGGQHATTGGIVTGGGSGNMAALVESVKTAITGGNASASTLTTLQSLLGSTPTPEAVSRTASRTTKGRAPAAKTARPARAAPKAAPKSVQSFSIHEDEPSSLSPKAKYALATEVVNITLKALSDAAKSSSSPNRRTSCVQATGTPRRASQSQRALQMRSGNATPMKKSPEKSAAPSRRTSQCSVSSGSGSHAVAECARLAFSYLETVDTKGLGLRELPILQLETGMVMLCGKLVALGLHTLAVKELRRVRKKLIQLFSLVEKPKSTKPSKTMAAQNGDSESLASLLHIGADHSKCPEARPLISTYQLHVLQLLVSLRRPAMVEEALPYLEIIAPGSPVDVIFQHLAHSKDQGKATKQLEVLSKIVLQLSPSVSTSADETATNRSRSVLPLTAFRLQMLGLKIRAEAWKVANQQIDEEKDLAEPASRCLAALVRRSPHGINLFSTCTKACKELGLSAERLPKPSSTSQTISRVLSTLADRESRFHEAHALASLALDYCDASEKAHARYVAALARKLSTAISKDDEDHATTLPEGACEILRQRLGEALSGQSADYDLLLGELAPLLRKLQRHQEADISEKQLTGAIAGFASQYSRSFPGKKLDLAQEIIRTVLSRCGSNDKLLAWVSKDSCEVLISFGVLRTIAERASSLSIPLAWSTNNSAISLGRLIKILVLRAASTDPQKCINLLSDDKSQEPAERGALLEWQLKCLLDVAHKSKYKPALQKLLPEVFMRLAKVYSSAHYPLRRARVAALAYQTRESHPELLAPHHFSAYINSDDINVESLGEDQSLQAYAADVRATINVARLFYDGRPTPEQLQSTIALWHEILETVEKSTDLERIVDNPNCLVAQLTSLDQYFDMLGEYEMCLSVANMFCKLATLTSTGSLLERGLLRVARAHAMLGNTLAAKKAIDRAEEAHNATDGGDLAGLEYYLSRAELFLSMRELESCRTELARASEIRQRIRPDSIHTTQAQHFRRLHGRSWLLHSQYMSAIGQPGEALRTGKRAVKVLNSIWSALEKAGDHSSEGPLEDSLSRDEPTVEAVTTKVSKLNLKPESVQPKSAFAKPVERGAQFWPVAILLCSALTHISDVYVHHGIFNEANYSSESAIKIADSVGSLDAMARMRYHRIYLLTTAGMLEEAALCLEQVHEKSQQKLSTTIAGLKARAALSVKMREFEEAFDFLEQAGKLIEEASSAAHVEDGPQQPANAKVMPKTTKRKAPSGTGLARRPAKQPSKEVGRVGKSIASATVIRHEATLQSNSVVAHLKAEIALEKALLAIRLGEVCTTEQISQNGDSVAFKHRLLSHERIMMKVNSAIRTDFALNSLAESTLSYPALQRLSTQLGEAPLSKVTGGKKPGKSSRASKDKPADAKGEDTLRELLTLARESMASNHTRAQLSSTADVHQQYSRLANISMVMSATLKDDATRLLDPAREALNVDYPRIYAATQHKSFTQLEREAHSHGEQFAWPEMQETQRKEVMTANAFQSQYIDILPRPWTAVSICLNDACDELYIAKYRRAQPPLMLRLPFSRQKSDETDEDVFDFEVGRAELREIVELSNYTCHQPVDTARKGAKTAWWNEREELDRRLQGLLINMENIWFGGFKGVLSCHERDQDRLDKFRKALEATLERHLPSRKGNKKASTDLSLHDQILELFTGLGADVDAQADIDECLADLLYFVVDILQFNGERNAYDEVDFDSMAIEVLDAIRAYHDDLDSGNADDQNMILILDRRLQAFPWENMPCLEKMSVSRVDSMETLRERIVQMRQENTDAEIMRHIVPRSSGSYILNPSSDLKSTEATLLPELSKLNDNSWTSIVRREPSEEGFTSALSTSSSLLYFGHGAGSQYIRPRAIRKLDKCSEVVWLMGCSSGAVTEYDELEPFAVPLAYMQAGSSNKCMSVVATLWDVTDKDIDRFSLAVGEEWGLWSAPQEATKLPVKTPRKRERLAAPCTPEKTPKTLKVKKTPARSRSVSRPRVGEGRKKSLVEAVAKSREACYLRYLNGAAPVVWGVPVWLGD